MKFNKKTSLFALIFAIGTSGAFAAPTVRVIGGPGTIPGAASGSVNTTGVADASGTTGSVANAGTAMRSGSLRTVSTSPKATVSTSNTGGTSVTQPASSGTAVSVGGSRLSSRGSSTPRLSTGRYIGAPGTSISTDPSSVDLSGKVDKDQGTGAAGHVLSIDDGGFVTNENEVYFKPEMDEKLAEKLDNTADPDQYSGKALVVTESGDILPVGEFLAPGDVDISTKVDKKQGVNYTGNALIVNADGMLEPSGEFVKLNQGPGNENRVLTVDANGKVAPDKIVYSKEETDDLLDTKLDDTADPEEYGGKALIVTERGEILPEGDFVNKFQGPNVAGRALIVNDQGYVTTGRVNTESLGLKRLAYEDSVRNELVDDQTLEREKMAESITKTLDWIDSWRDKEPTADDETRYVMAVDEYGQPAWFRVVTE